MSAPCPTRRAPQLVDWVENGGTLVRFAGSRLAAAGNDDDLLPVRLRIGERALGGALSWTEPQPVADFPPTGPFADLPPPADVTVTRQVLAEPTADIAERTWASLADGTPLVTGATARQGHARAVPRHAGGDLVEPADLRHLRRDAAPHRAAVAQPGRASPPAPTAGARTLRALPHDRRRRRAGAADAGCAAAGRRRRRACR